ncbi:MAG: S8 family serine peptidase [Salibacteraceae bacterium]
MIRIFLFTATLLLSVQYACAQSLQSTHLVQKELEKAEKKEWHNFYIKGDKVYGTGSNKTYEEILTSKKPGKKVVVAIIDSGVDTEHEDLSESIWVNEDEIPENGRDDDGNGFIDDVHGWNFLVDANGNDIGYDNLEATRVLRLSKELETSGEPYPEWLTKEMMERSAEIYNKQKQEMMSMRQFSLAWKIVDSTAKATLNKDEYSYDEAIAMEGNDNEDISNAKQMFEVFKSFNIQVSDLNQMYDAYYKMENHYLNLAFDPREGFDRSQKYYGNNHYKGEHSEHGTHVAGIVAATRDNEFEAQGIASDVVEIMVLRAVPDGDERDIDVANAIRYAADNGADIINMSFGKGVSPYKELVYEALEYAAEKGVLSIHAAGNDASNNDEITNYPNNSELSEKGKSAYLTIGALSPQKNKKMIASFSNYGEASVDLFAPGQDIYSTLPDNEYGFRSGTSMAAPAATGVAALVWAYNPDLSAAELKAVLIENGIDIGRKRIILPGTKKSKARFRTICRTGKVISAYDAINATIRD